MESNISDSLYLRSRFIMCNSMLVKSANHKVRPRLLWISPLITCNMAALRDDRPLFIDGLSHDLCGGSSWGSDGILHGWRHWITHIWSWMWFWKQLTGFLKIEALNGLKNWEPKICHFCIAGLHYAPHNSKMFEHAPNMFITELYGIQVDLL